MEKTEILSKLKYILCDEMEFDVEEDEFDSKLELEDIGVDSLRRIELIDQLAAQFKDFYRYK